MPRHTFPDTLGVLALTLKLPLGSNIATYKGHSCLSTCSPSPIDAEVISFLPWFFSQILIKIHL